MDAINVVTRLLNEANIEINGDNPWDIQVRDERFYSRILADGSLGLGEAYMEGWYDCKNLDQFIFNLLRGNLEEKYNAEVLVTTMAEKFKHLFNPQTINNCKKDISFHYDIGNNLFKHMLDPRMVYSCAYWKDAKDLNEAQEAKLDLICRKLDLKPGMTLLDIGCGWGSFMKYAAEKYGVICTGLTLSKEQIKLGKENCKDLPIEFIYSDYREFESDPFDRVVSIGMFEHVGPLNYGVYMQKAHEMLKEDGIFLLHTIGGLNDSEHGDKWIRKYIFPHGIIPSIQQVGTAIAGKFYMEDWEDFGPDYNKTLMAWNENFQNSWKDIEKDYEGQKYFKKMWEYYLLACAGAFRARDLGVWQIALTKKRLVKPICRV